MQNIYTALGHLTQSYNTAIQIVPGLFFKQKDQIRNIEFYSNSKYLNGQNDELGREKPFHQILNSICDVENAAKDIDTKDITITADDGNHYTQSFLLSKDIYEWMKESNFAKTLNDMRDTHTRYGSLLVKKVRRNGELRIEIPEWKNLITDQVDVVNNPIVEIHYMTPTQLVDMSAMGWDAKNVDEVATKAIKSGYTNRIPVYEVRGNFPVSYYKEITKEKPSEEDKKTFSYQLYYLAGEPSSRASGEVSAMDDSGSMGKLTPLYWENDTEDCYKYLARKKKSGRGFGVGVFEEGEQAQVWTNDAVLKQARAMELTTKSISQTASKKLKGRNLLNETDDGTILEIEADKPINPVNLLPSGGLNQYSLLIDQWYNQLEKTTSAYSAQRGESPPSRTAFKLQATVLQQSSSVFRDLKQEFGIFITEIFEDWIMPDLMKDLNKEHILAHEFSVEELKEIDKNFSTYKANQMAIEKMLNNELVDPQEYQDYQGFADEQIKLTKSKRFLEVPKGYYKDMAAKVTVNTTGEQMDKGAVLESLGNIMMVYAKNPQIAQDPVLMQIFLRILELSGSGISPVSLVGAIEEAKKMQEEKMALEAQAEQEKSAPEAPAPAPLKAV